MNNYTVRGLGPDASAPAVGAARALSWAAAVALLGLLLLGLAGCSPAGDSEIEKLVALDLADAIAQEREMQ